MAGEWHNNHHACPASARMGFMPGQLDLGFMLVRLLHALGVVSSYTDQRELFRKDYMQLETAGPR
jgi:stearoyl-CoA desaturase (delta-9 desaturase)